MRSINQIIVHCSATKPGMDIGVLEIRRWHKDRGFSDIGYHFVIRRSGRIENGRPAKKPGAHAKGHNADSIGICLVGGIDDKGKPQNNFTEAQELALRKLLGELCRVYKVAPARIVGYGGGGHKHASGFRLPTNTMPD